MILKQCIKLTHKLTMHLFYEMPNSVTHQGRVLVLYVLFKIHKTQAVGECLYLIKHGFKWFLITTRLIISLTTLFSELTL